MLTGLSHLYYFLPLPVIIIHQKCQNNSIKDSLISKHIPQMHHTHLRLSIVIFFSIILGLSVVELSDFQPWN